MFTTRFYHFFSLVAGCFLILLVAACGGSPAPAVSQTPGSSGSPATENTGTATMTSTPGAQATTVSMPPTQTSCPLPLNSGRAAVMSPLAPGSDPNVVYIFNQGPTAASPGYAELKRYDVVTGSKTVIVHLPGVSISEAQVSNDGQWILFNSLTPTYSEIQMVRIDSQGLQTLLCVLPTTLHSIQWSPDHSMIVYSAQSVSFLENVYTLNMATGAVQPEIVQNNTASMGFEARSWLDNTRVYLVGVPNPATPSPIRSLYLLDTKQGPNQPISNLQQVIPPTQPQYCWSFDNYYNNTKLVTSQCTVTFPSGSTQLGIQQGPSMINAQAITGGSSQNIYNSQNFAVTEVRLLGNGSTSLLLTVENQNYGSTISVNSSENGLWKMYTNGTGLTRLTTVPENQESNLNRFSQYPWSNISRDGTMYAVQVTDLEGKTPKTRLFFGPVSGGNPTFIAYAYKYEGTVEVAGWTTM